MAFQPFEYWVDVNLKAEPPVVPLRNGFFTQDNMGALLGARVYVDRAEHPLTGEIPYYAKLADGTTFESIGQLSGNKAYVELPKEVYAAVGPITITIANKDGEKQKALVVFTGFVFETKTNAQVAPGQAVADLAQLQALYHEMQTTMTEVRGLLDNGIKIQDDPTNNGFTIIF